MSSLRPSSFCCLFLRKMLIDGSSFLLEDKENENALGFCVKDSLVKARQNKVRKNLNKTIVLAFMVIVKLLVIGIVSCAT